MGIQEHIGNGWLTTEKGLQYQLGKTRIFNADAWHASLVDAVCNYLQSKNM